MREYDLIVLTDYYFWIRILVSIICGGIIGLERTLRHKPVGLRTTILICLGSTVFMLVNELLADRNQQPIDPTRIAAQVVTGVGFLGAGAIIHQGLSVVGLTTAATIWVVAGIGVVIGAGFPLVGITITAFTILTLIPLNFIEHKYLGH